MNTYTFPSNARLETAAQKLLPQLEESIAVLSMFPRRNINENLLLWEQYDNYQGLMKSRGMNGEPGRLAAVGMKRYSMIPGVYGSFGEIDENELTVEREMGSFNEPINIDTLVMRRMVQTLDAEVRLREYLTWVLLATGTFTSTDDKGNVLDSKSFTQRVFTATTAWSTIASATPLQDLRAVSLLHAGFSVAFDSGATAYANKKTVNNLLNNTNASDLGGKRRTVGATFNSLGDVNAVLIDNDLPVIKAYDEGFINDSGVFTRYIPDNTVIVKGRRLDGQPLGEWLFTRNVNNPGGTILGPYVKVVDNINLDPPRKIRVHRGFNGGPVIKFPSGYIIMQV